ncbi:MAG TPA: AAA family ATPase [Thermoleophilaceae bacterium]|nr:AAA family ATPase [Thermoleophilaceae bacterium]
MDSRTRTAPLSITATVLCVGVDCSPPALRAAVTGNEGDVERVDGTLVAVFGSLAGALAAATLAERRGAGGRAPRIGIAHGEVVRRTAALEGPAVDEAVALAGRAERGQVLVGDAVELLASGGHRFARRSGAAAELEWEEEVGVPLPDGLLAAARRGACVGRGRELDVLLRELDAVRVGERRVVLLTGEPGIGKTRLAAEAGLAAHARGALVLYGRSDEGLALPYQAFAEALGHLISTAPAELLEPAGSALGRLASLVPAARERAAGAAAPEDGHGGERYVLFGAVGAVLSAASARQPVVLVLDDLHWADVPSVLLLHHLLAVPSRPRLLVIATCRPLDLSAGPELSAALAQLRRDERLTDIGLKGLGEGEVLDMVEELAGAQLAEGEREYARALHRETDGNPLFVSEVIRGLGGREEIAAAAAALENGGETAALAAPASLRDLIVGRAAALGAEALAVLEAAAVIGREFDAALLARVADLDEERIANALDRAEHEALIVPVGGGPGRFAFHHLLIGHTLYEALGAARRARLHRRVGEALEGLAGDASHAEMARHWAEASPPDRERALRYAELAGRHALREIDPDAALRWLERALELHGPAPDQRRCSLLIALGVAQRKHGDARFREPLLEAARLGRRLGEPKLLVRATIENTRGFASDAGEVDSERVAMLEAAIEAAGPQDSRERAVLLGMLAFELSFEPDRSRRVAVADESLAVARRLNDPRTLCYVLGARSMPIWSPDTLEERLACTAESVRLADGLGDPLARFHALHWRGVALVQTGEMEELRRVVRRQRELAARLGEPSARWLARYDEATLETIAGRLADAERLAAEALEIATDSGQPDALSLYASQLTNIRYDQGRLADLQPMIAETAAENPGIPSFRALLALAYVEGELPIEAAELLATERLDLLPRDMTWLACVVLWGLVCAAVGDAHRAEALSALLRPYAGQVVYTGISAWGDVDHALGRLATVSGRYDDAARHLESSIARYTAIGAPVWLARATLDQASLLLARERPGDRGRARELLHQAEADARRLGAGGIERRAAVLLGHERATSVMSAPALRTAARPPAPAAPDGVRRAGLVREGELWTLTHAGGAFHLKDSKGLRYLARLLGEPHAEVHVVELQAGAPVPELRADAAAGGVWLDEQAKRAYRSRLAELEDDLAEAERFNDVERAARAREERELIGRELARAVGLGGRDRPAGSAAERARVNATRAIRAAIRRIEECDPSLGRHLDRAVRTGTFCAYDPAPQDEVTWTMNIVQPEGTPS